LPIVESAEVFVTVIAWIVARVLSKEGNTRRLPALSVVLAAARVLSAATAPRVKMLFMEKISI
jgi:hypothetical protein